MNSLCILSAGAGFAVPWIFRYQCDGPEVSNDLKWVLAFIAWRHKTILFSSAQQLHHSRLGLLLYFIVLLSLYLLVSGRRHSIKDRLRQLQWAIEADQKPGENSSTESTEHSPLKPLVFPCRTSHTRIFPKNHSFSYSYLMVGIPVGWRNYSGNLLSADLKFGSAWPKAPWMAWFSVDAEDHLHRGNDVGGLKAKLRSYLKSQNEDPNQYPHAYLLTAPRFLGYCFNPVSFWYLYNETRDLKAMILEVNNTFDERRLYLLRQSDGDDAGKFRNSWEKDFHVSPFNSRKGSYALTAVDPFYPSLSGRESINNTITLNSSKEHAKLVARIFSTSSSIDPYTVGKWGNLEFVASWWWVGFVTFPRIVREATKLFFRRKLHVWYRPEVLRDSIGRQATRDEESVALLFRDFLKYRLEHSTSPFSLRYTPATLSHESEIIFTSSTVPDKSPSSEILIEFKPTTPLFYAQIARSSSVLDFLKSAIQEPDRLKSTFYTSHPDELLRIFQEPEQKPHSSTSHSSLRTLPIITKARWYPLYLVRILSQNVLSPLDDYAVARADVIKASPYRKAVMKILLSDLLVFGNPEILDGLLWITRIWLCWMCAEAFNLVLGGKEYLAPGDWSGNGRPSCAFLGVHLW